MGRKITWMVLCAVGTLTCSTYSFRIPLYPAGHTARSSSAAGGMILQVNHHRSTSPLIRPAIVSWLQSQQRAGSRFHAGTRKKGALVMLAGEDWAQEYGSGNRTEPSDLDRPISSDTSLLNQCATYGDGSSSKVRHRTGGREGHERG